MIVITQHDRPYEKAGLLLVAVQFFMFIFGLPPFQTGFWYQTEPTLVAIFSFATLNAAWLYYGYLKHYLVIEKPGAPWICLLLWIGWQLITLPFADSGWRGWFGPAEIGEGSGWYVSVFLCVLVMHALWPNPRYQKIILLSAASAMLMETLLHALNYSDPYDIMLWRPARWPDYLAFSVAYFWVAMAASEHLKRPIVLCCMVILTYLVLLIATNLTGTILLAGAMLVTTGVQYPRFSEKLKLFLQPHIRWRKFALIGCVLPILWIGFSAIEPYFSLAKSDNVVGTLGDNDDSMGARVMLNRIALKTLSEEPSRLLTGSGWGNFINDSYKYALVDGVYAYSHGKRKSNSGSVTGYAFHSHDEPLEVLLALGIPGLLLWFAFPVVVLRRLPDRLFWDTAPMVVAIVCLYYFWFLLPQVMAFEALALCALCATVQPEIIPEKKSRMVPVMVSLAAITGIMTFSTTSQYAAMQYGDDVHFIPRQEHASPHLADWLEEDISRAGDRLRVGAEDFELWGWEVHNNKVMGNYDKGWHSNFITAARSMVDRPSVGVRNRMLLLWIQYKLLLDYGDKEHAVLRTEATQGIADSIMLLTRLAPEREDIAAPFLMNLSAYTKGDLADYVEILVNILKIYPEHRSALWLLGHIYLGEPSYAEEGTRMIRHALDLGVDRVYPVTDEEIQYWRDQPLVNVTGPADSKVKK